MSKKINHTQQRIMERYSENKKELQFLEDIYMAKGAGYKLPPAGDTAALVALTSGRVLDAVLGALAGVAGGAIMGATSFGAQGMANGITGLATQESGIWFDSQGNFQQGNMNKQPGSTNKVPNNSDKNPSNTSPTENIQILREELDYIKKIIRILGKKAGIDVDDPHDLAKYS